MTPQADQSVAAVRVWVRDDDHSSLLVKVVYDDGSALTVLVDDVRPAPVGDMSLWQWTKTENGSPSR